MFAPYGVVSISWMEFIFICLFLLTIRKNTIYKLMWWLYKVRYDTMYYYDVVEYSSSDVIPGVL